MIPDMMETAARIKQEIQQSTVIPCANIKLSVEPCTVFDSKVGGLPYLPPGTKAPTNPKGKKLYLLAQINCEDIAQLPDFPHTGMLQFFIFDNDLYGCPMTFPAPQKEWRVVYYPTVNRDMDVSYVSKIYAGQEKGELMPFEGEFRMTFDLSSEGMSPADYRYESAFFDRWKKAFPDDEAEDFYDLDDDILEMIFDDSDEVPHHKMGGYPYFTQNDPRFYEGGERYDTLLFQLDSDRKDGVDVLWGDVGVGNFFVNREALKRLDFSDVLYNWDCG